MARKNNPEPVETPQEQANEQTPASVVIEPEDMLPDPGDNRRGTTLDVLKNAVIRIKAPRTGILMDILPGEATIAAETNKDGIDIYTIEAVGALRFTRTMTDYRGTEHITPGVF